MQKWFHRARSQTLSLTSAATLLVAAAFTSQVLGFLRVKLINANFPTIGPNSTDSYFAAFNIPDFFFYTLAAGALGVAFMPVLAEYLHRGDRKGLWDIANSLMNLLAMIMAAVAVIILLFAPWLIHHIVAPKLPPQQLHQAATIMRLLALNPLLFTISGILTASQQTLGRFFFYALAPLLYNISIIVSAVIFSVANGRTGGPHNLGLTGLGVGALVGAIIQLLVVLVGLVGLKYQWRPKIMWRSSDFRSVLRNLPPRSFDQGLDQIEAVVETNLASRIYAGAITSYNNAFTMENAGVMLIGSAISTAAFPRMTNRLAQNRPDLFRKDFLKIFRVILWIALLGGTISFFGRGYLAHMIYSRNSNEIATVFGFLAGALLFRTMYALISRWFYAQKDTVTPLVISVFAILLNVILATTLARPSAFGIEGLAIAQSVVATAEVIILLIVMVWRDRTLLDGAFWDAVFRILSVTGFTVVTAYTMAHLLPLTSGDRGFMTLFAKLSIIAIPTALVHIGASYFFGLEEVRPVVRKLRTLILKPIRIADI